MDELIPNTEKRESETSVGELLAKWADAYCDSLIARADAMIKQIRGEQ